MSFWIFKTAEHSVYPDVLGREYVYDNTHSVRVAVGDEFLYLKKEKAFYGLTGAGRVSKVASRMPSPNERRTHKVTRVFSAHLADVTWFTPPFDLSSQRNSGMNNRRKAGLPGDVNSIGWSISMPRLSQSTFQRLLNAALDATTLASTVLDASEWLVEDSWSLVRQRARLQAFRSAVLTRHNNRCVVCGTSVRAVLEVAHIKGYAVDPNHRANPANGICLCRYCHACFDAGHIDILPDGKLVVNDIDDSIAVAHFSAIASSTRRQWLEGIEPHFLTERAATRRISK